MRESTKSYLKRILSGATFILACLIVLIGMTSGAFALLHLSDGLLKLMPYILMAVCAFSVGFCICFLAIRLPRDLAESRNLSKEEKVIRNIERYMEQRNWRILMFTLLVVLLVSASMFSFWRQDELNKMASPEQFRSRASFENPKRELPVLFARLYNLSSAKAKVMVYTLYFGSFTGIILAMLIADLAGWAKNRHRLTVSMWHTIKRLESEVEQLKASPQADGRPIDPCRA